MRICLVQNHVTDQGLPIQQEVHISTVPSTAGREGLLRTEKEGFQHMCLTKPSSGPKFSILQSYGIAEICYFGEKNMKHSL